MSINLNDLTLGQLRELLELPICAPKQVQPPIPMKRHPFVGLYVIARCYAAGVHAGDLVDVDGENVILKNSRRLWSWKAKDGVALSGLAMNGLADKGCKIDTLLPIIYLAGVCELIPCATATEEQINAHK